jgi:hypothetical protein
LSGLKRSCLYSGPNNNIFDMLFIALSHIEIINVCVYIISWWVGIIIRFPLCRGCLVAERWNNELIITFPPPPTISSVGELTADKHCWLSSVSLDIIWLSTLSDFRCRLVEGVWISLNNWKDEFVFWSICFFFRIISLFK